MTSWNELDPEGPSEADLTDDTEPTVRCPSCGESIFEDAEKCPYCGDWVVTTGATARLHWIWALAALLALAGMLVWTVF